MNTTELVALLLIGLCALVCVIFLIVRLLALWCLVRGGAGPPDIDLEFVMGQGEEEEAEVEDVGHGIGYVDEVDMMLAGQIVDDLNFVDDIFHWDGKEDDVGGMEEEEGVADDALHLEGAKGPVGQDDGSGRTGLDGSSTTPPSHRVPPGRPPHGTHVA